MIFLHSIKIAIWILVDFCKNKISSHKTSNSCFCLCINTQLMIRSIQINCNWNIETIEFINRIRHRPSNKIVIFRNNIYQVKTMALSVFIWLLSQFNDMILTNKINYCSWLVYQVIAIRTESVKIDFNEKIASDFYHSSYNCFKLYLLYSNYV